MQYFLHKEGGHVASLDDHEKPSYDTLVGGPEMYIPVHLHPGAGRTHREPSTASKVFAVLFVSVILSGAIGGLALLWKAVFA